MPSLLSTAMKAAPAAMRLAKNLHSATGATQGSKIKPKPNLNIRVQIPRGNPAKNGKAAVKALGKSAKSLAKATSHMKAMGKQPGLGGLLKHGLKAAKELQGVARQLSKLSPGSGARKGGEGAHAEPHAKGGERAAVAQPKGVKLMVGRPQKNWEQATAENGFHEAYRGKPGADGKSLRVMVGKPQKNWEQATPEHGYRELKTKGGGTEEGGKKLRFMVGPVHKNWEHATAENGFTEWKGKSGEPGKGLKIMIGKPQRNWEAALEQVAPRREGGRPRANAVVARPEADKPVGLQINLQFRTGGTANAKKGKASLTDLVKVARGAHALGKALAKSHE